MSRIHDLPFAPLALAALLAGCATTPETPAALEDARAAFQAAKTDPNVPRYAPAELNQAGRTLDQAEHLWTKGENADQVAHRAYLAKQQARIAAETASARAAHAQIEQADVQRKSAVAEARAQEAQAQQRDAEAARKSAEAERAAAIERAEQAQRQAEQQQEHAKQLAAELEAMKADKTSRGWVLTLGGDVLFDVGQATLKPGAFRSIDQLAGFLRANPDRSITIEGYTDNTGSESLNLDLSQRRADAVKQALIARNVDPRRIDTRAYGEAFPKASNATAAGRQLNRRVEVVIPNAEMRAASR